MDWNVSPKEAIELQKKLRSQIKIQPFKKKITLIGGADISLNRFSDVAYSGIVLLSYPALELIGYSLVKSKITFPYIPGLLSFREIPSLMQCWEQLTIKPDVLVVDGQGIAHPRRMGIATHFGMEAQVPTIGCAKSPLIPITSAPENIAGSSMEIYDHGEKVGFALRTKKNSKPVIVSPGYLTDFKESLEIIKNCCRGYRIPEPTRLAHEIVNQFRKGEIAEGMSFF